VLILSGDQLYRMDFAKMLATHEEHNADVTIAAKPVARSEAHGLGIMRVDNDGRVVGFREKPKTDAELNDVATAPSWIDERGIKSNGRDCLASMGIYLFRRETLLDVLEKTSYHDFGREIFPAAIRTRCVQLHLFDGYWEDIGTIRSFYEANLMLAQANPPFELASATAPIFSRARFLPPTRCDGATVERSLLADGCVIGAGTRIENSVVGLRCQIGKDVIIRNSIIMGADYYETPGQLSADCNEGRPPVGIGAGAVIDGAIVDKNCHIGAGAKVTPGERTTSYGLVGPDCTIRDGILIVGKNGVVPEGWHV
jgi:glucose-1-phosphate adenylyltransferase